jgi:NAD(P)-dependent dehydrogenase (short-subunit alcohol dehydrogenase family)
MSESLSGKTLLITGAAKRLRRIFALACAREGANVVIHHAHSDEEAQSVRAEIDQLGRDAWVLRADLSVPSEAEGLIPLVYKSTPLHGLVNSVAIFGSLCPATTSLEDWHAHLQINLTALFLLSRHLPGGRRKELES